MPNMKIVERNFRNTFDISNVFSKNVEQWNKIVNKQRSSTMLNIKMRTSSLKLVVNEKTILRCIVRVFVFLFHRLTRISEIKSQHWRRNSIVSFEIFQKQFHHHQVIMFHLQVSVIFETTIDMNVFSFTGNTPPDYRQTDMDLSDNEDNNCKCVEFLEDWKLSILLFPAKSPSDRTSSKNSMNLWFERCSSWFSCSNYSCWSSSSS